MQKYKVAGYIRLSKEDRIKDDPKNTFRFDLKIVPKTKPRKIGSSR